MAIINGTAGNDTRIGTADADTINGLAGNDTITGGLGNDLARLGAGNDRFIWRFGDGDDTVRGQDGFDTLVFEGFAGADPIGIERNASRVRVSEAFGDTLDLDDVERIVVRTLAGVDGVFIGNLARTDVEQVVVDLAGVPGGSGGDGEVDRVVRNGGAGNDVINVALVSGAVSITGPSAQVTIRNAETQDDRDILEINSLGGSDTIDASKLPLGVMQLTVNGGAGNDRITGSRGKDKLDGGDGNDVIVGGRGIDSVDLGTGNDLYAYSVGHGNDSVQGGAGIDTLRITCINGEDTFSIQDIGLGALSIAEPSVSPFLTAAGIERIQIRALGGADFFAVTDLTDSGVKEVAIDLAASVGGTVADTDADTVSIQDATIGGPAIEIESSGSNVFVSGLTEEIRIAHAGKNDTLLVRGSIGSDVIDATGLAVGKILLRLEGDSGDDFLFGSDGNDRATGGAGNDVASLGAGNDLFVGGAGNDVASLGTGNDRASGDAGNDLVLLGAGNDVFIWRPGDGIDTVDGQAGFDTFDFKGGVADIFVLNIAGSAQLQHGGEAAVLTDVERIRVQASDGSDVVHLTSLASTDIKQVLILDFDGNPLGGQDVLDLDPLFDDLGVESANRAGRVSIVDNGATVDVFVNADGNAGNGFELAVATLQTPNTITLGQDVVVEFF